LERASVGARHEIAYLREFRTRLIADVVTGKLDVREAASHLPEAVGDAPQKGGVSDAGEMVDDDGLDTADDEAVA
jgi:hypothetical protein